MIMNYGTQNQVLYRIIEVQRGIDGRLCNSASPWHQSLDRVRGIARTMPISASTLKLRLVNTKGEVLSTVLPEDQMRL